MARRRRACPTLFCVSDNGLSISFKTRGWADAWAEQRLGMRLFRADGSSLPQVPPQPDRRMRPPWQTGA